MKPACMSNQCPVVDVAPDIVLNRKVRSFLQSEGFETSPAYAHVQRRLLDESGLSDETAETLLEMKAVMAEYRNSISRKS